MHVVLRGITIWTLYTFVSRASVACLSTTNRLRLELVYDPMPDELFEPYQYHPGRAIKRLFRRRSHGMVAAVTAAAAAAAAATAAVHRPKAVKVKPTCDCARPSGPTELGDGAFPNQVPEVRCAESPWCRKVVYPIRVLTKQRVAGVEYTQDDLPADLKRADWWSYEHNVTVACHCYHET